MLRALLFPVGALALVLGCGRTPEQRVLAAAGVETTFPCRQAEGIDRTTFCGGLLPLAAMDSVIRRLALQPLATPAKHGRVTNFMQLPFECRILLFDQPHPQVLFGVRDSPFGLKDPGSSVQFASVVLTRASDSEASCFTFVREP
jgi:hypothetical protein